LCAIVKASLQGFGCGLYHFLLLKILEVKIGIGFTSSKNKELLSASLVETRVLEDNLDDLKQIALKMVKNV
jgi:hypothetical protein